ncbi:MAG: sulfotransferase [Gammaproteobacteria bacterium]|nr:sulfotransferase [Gammaproteobacteria bacterium]
MVESAHPLVIRAREAFARGELRSAELAAEERLKTAGRDVNALEVRYQLQKHRGQMGEAARTLDTVIGINSRADWAHNELIQLLMTHGKLADAEQVARAALRANPGNAQAHNVFGLIVSDMNDLPSGEWHFRRALELAAPQAAFLLNLANNLMKQGRTHEADGYFARAHELAPKDLRTLTCWSTLHEARGELARAQELLDRAEAVSPAADVNLLRSNYLARAGRHEEALAIIDSAKALAGDGQLARGRLHDRLGRYEEAWADFVAGKRKLAAEGGGLQYKADAVEALFGRLKHFFTRENIARLPRTKPRADVPQPIFIMGFPRSGTTLVEQILCSHSAVMAGGELPFLGELRKLAGDLWPGPQPFPESLAQSWTADRHYAATMFRDYYLARAERYGLANGGKAFFTDKMPFNEVYLPLLKMAFPEAKIIHARRHPLDVCVSTMSNDMTHGFNCGYRIEDTAHHLAAVFDLVEHYRHELEVGDYVLQYEALVADQPGQTRRLLDYLGLPFEEACLRFHESRHPAPTAGHSRVTEKLNDGSIGRYRNYAQPLKTFVPRLERIITACGYK